MKEDLANKLASSILIGADPKKIFDFVEEEAQKEASIISYEEGFEQGREFEAKHLKKLLNLAEIKLDEHNGEYGTKEKLCLCCGGNDYDSIIGVLHYPYCIIRRIREILK